MITLTPKEQPEVPIEIDTITPDSLAGKTIDEIKNIPILHGNGQVPLAEFFEVEGEAGATAAETKILIDGDVSQTKRIGQGMTAGEITVKGNVNMYVGAEMEGGLITVEGNANAWAGQNMRGGELEILGDAGDYVGASYRGDWRGMSGGKITIHGNAKSEIAEYMNGGKLIVKGDVSIMPGIHMNNGVLIIEGNVIARAGGEMAGGTIVIKGIIDEFLAGFEYLGVEKDIEVEGEVIPGAFYKFKGDYAIKGASGIIYAAVAGNAHIAP
ncbi:formylmethanofuran dehydrogenase subunit C [Methanobacterium subterraneum]|jgi:formylmethanofuran dehydrogenase subunit C|uniref:Tungsten-containing formylmethanofuran dehydrogenase 2 subunit C n=1 Tax=Methanobacterium subterraneum TaxID=59277 RepID=A0A2H4VAI9_9EURY|nr:tungsten-dependent formylmethanofuran dehydrogenase subunit FwdC [Methanobacterium subterraneum]AUB55105.1 formylmethanofuran dehydrogenase subunit C [Methanobacterium subterraneum]